jgi:hypothetical protein
MRTYLTEREAELKVCETEIDSEKRELDNLTEEI